MLPILPLVRTPHAGGRRSGCGGDSHAGLIELELLQLGGHDELVRAVPGGSPAGKGLGVQPIELLVVVERIVVEEEEALCLGEPSEGEHVAEAGVPPADATRVLVVRVLTVVGEKRAPCARSKPGSDCRSRARTGGPRASSWSGM